MKEQYNVSLISKSAKKCSQIYFNSEARACSYAGRKYTMLIYHHYIITLNPKKYNVDLVEVLFSTFHMLFQDQCQLTHHILDNERRNGLTLARERIKTMCHSL